MESVFLESCVGAGTHSHACWYVCALVFVLLINLFIFARRSHYLTLACLKLSM